MKEAEEHLTNWVNAVTNEMREDETLEYSEREVIEMLKDYKDKFSLCGVGVRSEQFICHDEDTYGKRARCNEMCVPCRGFNK